MGISNYFDPTAVSRATRSGSGGVLGGTSITVPGALKSASSPPQIATPQVARPQAERTESLDPDSDDPENIESRLGSREDEEGTINQEVVEQLLREREQQQFEDAEEAIKEAIEKSPELADVAESIQIDSTPRGCASSCSTRSASPCSRTAAPRCTRRPGRSSARCRRSSPSCRTRSRSPATPIPSSLRRVRPTQTGTCRRIGRTRRGGCWWKTASMRAGSTRSSARPTVIRWWRILPIQPTGASASSSSTSRPPVPRAGRSPRTRRGDARRPTAAPRRDAERRHRGRSSTTGKPAGAPHRRLTAAAAAVAGAGRFVGPGSVPPVAVRSGMTKRRGARSLT